MTDMSDCGCCGGTAIDTPTAKFNRPGLPAIAYRIGTQPQFKATLLARLSSTDFPALAGLTTRNDSDYTIALCDAFATVADVLTFYQERIANEAFLRTAIERRSVLELAQLIGYRLAPGVAAGTALAFTLQEAPGQPSQAAQPVTIPAGTRVQSVPDPGQAPQTFETTADITAQVGWNAIRAQRTEPVGAGTWYGRRELHLAGTATQLQAGDALLFVGAENGLNLPRARWEVRWLDSVDADAASNTTRVTWPDALDQLWVLSNLAYGVRVYAVRQRAAQFGNNAPAPQLIFTKQNPDTNGLTNGGTGDGMQWANFGIAPPTIDLDAVYPKVTQGGWIVMIAAGTIRLYGIAAATQVSRADFGLSAKITRVTVDIADDLSDFGDLRATAVLAQSEELTPVARPLTYPVYGNTIPLDLIEAGLVPGQLLAASGARQRIVLGGDTSSVVFPDDSERTPVPGESLVMAAAPELLDGSPQATAPAQLDPLYTPAVAGRIRWHAEDALANPLTIEADAGAVALQPAAKDDAIVSEVSTIDSEADAVTRDSNRTTVTLQLPLTYCYDRSTFAFNANVAPATHGETVSEIAGGGDASQANQSFTLKQPPLTYVSAPTSPSGCASTLRARVNDLLWSESPTLYGQGPTDRVYALRQDDAGNTTILFGDGIEGARLATGQNNLRLTYRKGIGSGGKLRAGQLTNLLTRPLGVQGVTNPAPATGGQDPETLDSARADAPLRVLTLDRAVSVEDYADFARTFAGIGKASAAWISAGSARGIHLTIAGPHGAAIPDGSDTITSLIGALRNYGDALLPLSAHSYAAATFTLQATVKIAADADTPTVMASIDGAMRAAYGFDARDFGEPVTLDEVYAVIQGIPGVLAVAIQQLYRTDTGAVAPQPASRLLAALATVAADGSVSPAELLTLDPAPLQLGAMP
jgi:hypothetical protein